ncbi:MAG: diiron oxygenase [Kofleriaceae bacterium]
MDLGRMLEKCHAGQWHADDLDWSAPPPRLPRAREEAVVQAFTDMAGIERLAAALFEAQARKATDPTLRAIFASFVVDEARHAVVAARLARYYDVHRYRAYRLAPALVAFRAPFLAVIEQAPPEIANAYVTAGELLLDVALLRSLDDYVGDPMSHQAMALINRDEARHIAIDFHMTEVYSSDAYLAARAARPGPTRRAQLAAAAAVARMLWHAQAFLKDVFLTPIDLTDPSGRRLREALKRIQLVGRKPQVARLPFMRVMLTLQDLYLHPLAGPLLAGVLLRLLGAEPRLAQRLYTDAELAQVATQSFDQLAADALGERAP